MYVTISNRSRVRSEGRAQQQLRRQISVEKKPNNRLKEVLAAAREWQRRKFGRRGESKGGFERFRI